MGTNVRQGVQQINFLQGGAVEEQVVRDHRQTFLHIRRLQAAAAFKHAAPVAVFHFLQFLGNGDLRQTDAVSESMPANDLQIGRKLHIHQRGALGEGSRTDVGNRIRNVDLLQGCTAGEDLSFNGF